MDQYVTGSMIREMREKRGMTQADLAQRLCVSDKAVSKWETGKGYPDITLIEPLARALGVSVLELMAGSSVINRNRSFQMLKTRFYVCPICGNVITGTGEAVISCCGLTLQPLEAEEPDAAHEADVSPVEDEYFVSIAHDMSKEHYISFVAGIGDTGIHLVKLYPEGAAEVRLPRSRTRLICWYCNRHGLFRLRLPLHPPVRKV